MEPVLKNDDRILAARVPPFFLLKRRSIVIFDLSKADNIPQPKPAVVIKRLVGLPGDVVKMHKSQMDEDMILAKQSVLKYGRYEILVPASHFLVSADGSGTDSRHWGMIPFKALLGVYIRHYRK